MEDQTQQSLLSTKQKVTIGVLVAVIVALVGSLLYINRSQDIRDRASEPQTAVTFPTSSTSNPNMCPSDGAMCSWKSISGATYCYTIFKKVNGQWQQLKPASGDCTRTTDNSVPFTSEKNGEYKCDVKVVDMPVVKGIICPTPAAGSATQICSGIASTPTPVGSGSGTPAATATAIPTSTSTPSSTPSGPNLTATSAAGNGSNNSGVIATATPKKSSGGSNPGLPKAGFLEFSLAFAAFGLLIVLFGFSL